MKLNGKLHLANDLKYSEKTRCFNRTCGCSLLIKKLHQQCFVRIQVGLSGMPLSECERLLNRVEPGLWQ